MEVVSEEPDRDVIARVANAYDVADDGSVKVVRRVSRVRTAMKNAGLLQCGTLKAELVRAAGELGLWNMDARCCAFVGVLESALKGGELPVL